MKRRTFIRLGIGTVAAAAFALYIVNFKRSVKSMLKDDTEHLQIDPSAIDKFIDDAEREKYWVKWGFVKQSLIAVQHFFYRMGLRLPYHEKYIQYRNMIVGHFLLSTDLFMNRMDASKPVHYLAFFNPYKAPCSNPFSNLLYQS